MSEFEDKAELGGLARTIDALFADRPVQKSADASADVMFVEEEAEPSSTAADAMDLESQLDGAPPSSSVVAPTEPPEPLDAHAAELAGEIEAFLNGPEGARAEHAARISEIGEAMMNASTFDPLVSAVEELAGAAGDPPAPHIIAVAETLLFPAVSSRIVARLGVEKDEARKAELHTICVRLGHPMALALSDTLAETTDRNVRHACVAAIVAMGDAAMPVVEVMIEDNRWFVVRNAVAVLGDVGGGRAIELVMGSLANSDGRVRREALHALAKLGGVDAGQLAYGMLEDPDPEVRLAAATTCGELKVERALKQLVKMLEDEKKKPDAVVTVLRALGHLRDPAAVNAIEKHAKPSLFSKPRTDVRVAAYRALNYIGTPRARRLLNQAADDKDPKIKHTVRDMLGMG